MTIPILVDRAREDKRAKNRGEDAPPVNEEGMLIICDGTGATGQAEHDVEGEVYTSAYLGSRETSRIAQSFFSDNYIRIMDAFSDDEALAVIVRELGETIRSGLRRYVANRGLTLNVRGRSFKLLPTTFTAVVYREKTDGIDAVVFCAGDSHALWWDTQGLHQLSNDDAENTDSLFAGDCNVNNCISADADFHISYLTHRLPRRGILLAASDGFSDPIKPFEQEQYLIEWIGNSDHLTQEEADLMSGEIADSVDNIGFTKRDDFTMAGVIVGYESGEDIKIDFRERYPVLARDYINKYHKAVIDGKKAEAEQESARASLLRNKKEIVRVIEKCVTELAEQSGRIDQHSGDEAVRMILSASAIRNDIREIDEAAKKEQQRLRNLAAEKEAELKRSYLDFLRELCFLPRQMIRDRFPVQVIAAACSVDKLQAEIERLCREFNSGLSKIKMLNPVAPEADDAVFKDAFGMKKSFSTMSSVTADLEKKLKEYRYARKTADGFFSYRNEAVRQYFDEDFSDGFRFLEASDNLSFINAFYAREKLNQIKQSARELLEKKQRIDRMNTDSSDAAVESGRAKAYAELIKQKAPQVADELFRNEEYIRIVPADTYRGFAEIMKSCRDSAARYEESIRQKKDLWATYSDAYLKHIARPACRVKFENGRI